MKPKITKDQTSRARNPGVTGFNSETLVGQDETARVFTRFSSV
jgi:hypothetical protein